MDTISKRRIQLTDSDLLTIDERIEEVTKSQQQPQLIMRRELGDVNVLYSGQPDPDEGWVTDDTGKLIGELTKSSRNIVPSFYEGDQQVKIEHKTREDVTDTDAIRRAIHTISNYYNTLGIYRDDFDKLNNDKLARNAYYAICEKAVMDYMGAVTYEITDQYGDTCDSAMDFFWEPNPQDGFEDILKMLVRDLVRYDAAVIVKSFNRGGHLAEIKTYMGTEFWREQDRVPLIINVPALAGFDIKRGMKNYQTPTYQGWWSHGYTERFWQRSRTGVYIPFQPEEIAYFMLYPRTDGIYGTDFLKYLKYQLQLLIDSTIAAGKSFENGMVPSVVFEHPEIRNVDQLKQRIAQMKAENQGRYKFGSVIHTVNGEKVTTLAQTLHEMEWLEGQKFVAQLIWAMWGFSPEEFMGGDSNRATSYVKRNITKSRLLYPMMDYLERKLNREVLPYLRNWRRGWTFKFIRDIDLDDEQKISQTNAIKATTVGTYLSLNFPVELALKLSNVGDDLSTVDVETLQQTISEAQMMEIQAGGQGMLPPGDNSADAGMEEAGGEQGRYGSASGMYEAMTFSDGGQGAESSKPRDAAKDEESYKKAEVEEIDWSEIRKGDTLIDDDGTELHVTFIDNAMMKAKVYIMHPSEAPRGRSVKLGSRGGYYYITTERHRGGGSNVTGSAGKKKRKKSEHKGWPTTGAREEPEKNFDLPEPPDFGLDKQVRVYGKGVGVVAGLRNGKLQVRRVKTRATEQFIRKVISCGGSPGAPEKFLSCMREVGKEMGLEVT